MDDRTHRDLVLRFLERTVAYADASIQRKLERGENATTIDPWRHHRDFTSRAIDELRAGHLDSWLERSDPSWVPQPTGRGDHDLERIEMDLNALSHAVRGTLLSGLISPRPTLLIGTHGPEGGGNLAPVSSLSIVSNHPPIATVSFGFDREGRPRDTWANLQDRPEGLLHVLPATPDAAAVVTDANAPLPRSESEWTAIDLDSMEHPSGLLIPLMALATIEFELIDTLRFAEATAMLAVLALRRLHVPRGLRDALEQGDGPDVLASVGDRRMVPAPWTRAWERRW